MGLRVGFNKNNHANIKNSVPDKSKKLERNSAARGVFTGRLSYYLFGE